MDKSIVFVTGSMCRGGAERVISVLANEYAEKNWNVYILMLLHNDVKYDLNNKVNVIDVSNDRIHGSKRIIYLLNKTRKVIKQLNPSVIVSFMAQICLITWFSCLGLKAKIVLSERIDPASVHRSFINRMALNYIYANCSCTVLQTERAQAYFPLSVRNNSVIIPNPVKVTAERTSNNEHVIVTAGRLTEQKNHKLLIEAFDSIHAKHPDYRLDIYGNGPLEKELKTQIAGLGLENVVKLKGNVANIHEHIKNDEIFVLSSDFEGLSNALIEAMMMGFPVVSTNCAGSDEIIIDGDNGLIVPTCDKGALVSAINRLIENDSFRERCGENAKNIVDFAGAENVIKKWFEVIEK